MRFLMLLFTKNVRLLKKTPKCAPLSSELLESLHSKVIKNHNNFFSSNQFDSASNRKLLKMWIILFAISSIVFVIVCLLSSNICCCRNHKKRSSSKEQKIEGDQRSWITQIGGDEDVEAAINIDEIGEKSSFLEPRTDFEDENDYEICVPANNDQLKRIVIVLQLQDTKNAELHPVPFKNNADSEPNQKMKFQGE